MKITGYCSQVEFLGFPPKIGNICAVVMRLEHIKDPETKNIFRVTGKLLSRVGPIVEIIAEDVERIN